MMPVLLLRKTPAGVAPDVIAKTGAGVPVAVTAKLPTTPTVNVAVFALVMTGGTLYLN